MDTTSKKPLSREELVERLKAIAADETIRVENHGAMCYCPAEPFEKHVPCDLCGSDISYDIIMGDVHETILELVDEMADWGYDVKVKTVCKPCAEKIKEELYPVRMPKVDNEFTRRLILMRRDPVYLGEVNHVFYFRTSSDEDYHRAISNDHYQYKALLALMQNQQMYSGDYDESHYLADEINDIEFLTGIRYNV